MVANSEPQTSTLPQIQRFNPWLSPEDPLELPLKLHSLQKDEYTFFRGTVDLYYDWCRDHCTDWIRSTDDYLILHGDVHLGNIGTYRAADGNAFAVVDLDETFTGPFQLDLLRGWLSLHLAASDNRVELSQADRAVLLEHYLTAYTDALTGKAKSEDLVKRHPMARALLEKADDGDPAELAEKFCEGRPPRKFRAVRLKKGRVGDIMTPVDGKTRTAFAKAAAQFLATDTAGFTPSTLRTAFGEKDILDVAHWSRIDSGGSQGVRKYLVLVAPNPAWDDAPLLLQFKEEPVPAAARAGLVSSTGGAERARLVSYTYLSVIAPIPRLVGHAEVDGRGYLIRTKDPFSEEPESGDFDTLGAIMSGARLLGETLGHAHRAALRVGVSKIDRVTPIAAKIKALSPLLAERGEAALAHLHERFTNLQRDAGAQSLVDVAKRRIKDAEKPDK